MTADHTKWTPGSHHTPNKPRVAVLSYHTSPLVEMGGPDAGGMNVYVRELCQALGSRGFALDVFTRRASVQAPDVQPFGPNVRVVHIEAGPPRRIAKGALPDHVDAFTEGVSAFARSEGAEYALVSSHYWLSGVAALRLAAEWHAPHVAMFHTLGEVKNRARSAEREPAERIEAERAIAAAADAVVVASSHERDLLTGLYGAREEAIVEVPCGIDLDLFTPIEKEFARERLGLAPGERIILFVGRIDPIKGIDILIGAAAHLHDNENFRVLIVGGDASALERIEQLRSLARGLGVEHHISFVGAVEHAELPLYYNAADVCVVPSFYESFGLVAVESMACGTPVVASRVGGLASTVLDGKTGYLVSWRNAAPFAERVGALLEDDDLRTAFGRASREAVEQYRWTNVADTIGALYQRLLAAHVAAGPVAGG